MRAGGPGAMNSKDKMQVTVKPFSKWDGKNWVEVTFNDSGAKWVPSFEDLFRIIQAICYCEDVKYPNGKGRFMVYEFLENCCKAGMDWEVLKLAFQIPDREPNKDN